jgi:hypothetical protein
MLLGSAGVSEDERGGGQTWTSEFTTTTSLAPSDREELCEETEGRGEWLNLNHRVSERGHGSQTESPGQPIEWRDSRCTNSVRKTDSMPLLT